MKPYRAAATGMELATLIDANDLAPVAHVVSMLEQAIRTCRGDLRRDTTVQRYLRLCVQRLPALQLSAAVGNPFTIAKLFPHTMQCLEDLRMTMDLYNDALLAVSATYEFSAQAPGGIAAVPPLYVPGQKNSYQRSYKV